MSESKLSANDPGPTYFSNAEVYVGEPTATLRKLRARFNMLISKGKKCTYKCFKLQSILSNIWTHIYNCLRLLLGFPMVFYDRFYHIDNPSIVSH
jgi:hypothetical protein